MEHPTLYRTTRDGTSIFYKEAGPTNAPMLLLLHGFPYSPRMIFLDESGVEPVNNVNAGVLKKTNIGILMIFVGAIALMTVSGMARASTAESLRWQTSAQL